jgi:hypothetical protein
LALGWAVVFFGKKGEISLFFSHKVSDDDLRRLKSSLATKVGGQKLQFCDVIATMR